MTYEYQNKTVLHCMSALYIMVMVTDGVMRKPC